MNLKSFLIPIKYELDELDAFDAEQLVKVIKREFDPDEGKIYISNTSGIVTEFYDQYDFSIFYMYNLKIIRDQEIYTLYIYYNQESIIIEEWDGNIVKELYGKTDLEIVRGYDDFEQKFLVYDQIDWKHLKDQLVLNEDEYVRLVYYDMPTNPFKSKTTNNFIIDRSGNITEITGDINLDSNLYVLYHASKYEKESEKQDGTVTHRSTDMIYYFVEK